MLVGPGACTTTGQPSIETPPTGSGAQLPLFTKTLYYVHAHYIDPARIDPRRGFRAALEEMPKVLPELFVAPAPADAAEVSVGVGGVTRAFSVSGVRTPWQLRQALVEVFAFVRENLTAGHDLERRLADLELEATNGMLRTLDRQSILLDPGAFAELRAARSGEGFLGLVLLRRPDGGTVVTSLVPDGSAAKAGVKPGDRLVAVGLLDTAPMSLEEIIDALRGPVGSTVHLSLERDGVPGTTRLAVARRLLRPLSIAPTARVLAAPGGPGRAAGKVGYFHLRAFSANATADVQKALMLFHEQKVSGVVMDLRGNQGGLFDQANQVAALFLKAGSVSTMLGRPGTIPKRFVVADNGWVTTGPLAVLVDHRSAAASEIVAAAIQELDRGVVLGERTAGAADVQMLFDVTSSNPAAAGKFGLKLTTARWVTTSGASLEGRGVLPDLEVGHACVGDGRLTGLSAPASETGEWERVSFFHWLGPGQTCASTALESDDLGFGDPGTAPPDELVVLARDLVARGGVPGRKAQLAGAKGFLAQVRGEEEAKLAAALNKLGADWTAGPAVAGRASLRLEARGGPTPVLRATIKNTGATPLHRVFLRLESSHPLVDGGELAFGKLAPGEARSQDLAVPPLREQRPARVDFVRASAVAGAPVEAAPAETTLRLDGQPPPLLSYRYQAVRAPSSKTAGHVTVRLQVELKNTADTAAPRLVAVLRSEPGQPGVTVTSGFAEVLALKPGETRKLSFEYEVDPAARPEEHRLRFSVGEQSGEDLLRSTLSIRNAGTEPIAGEITPPAVTLTVPALVNEPTAHLTGVATHGAAVRDVVVDIWNRQANAWRKVLYTPNQGDARRLTFAAEVPLDRGSNTIRVLARESPDVTTTTTVVVVRR